MLGKLIKKPLHPIILLDYPPRLVSAIAMACICASIIYTKNNNLIVWILLFCHPLLWPQMVLLSSCLSQDPKKNELRALIFDSFFAGCWMGVMLYCPWAFTTLFVGNTMGNVSVDGIPMLLKGIIAFSVGALFTGYFYHYEINFNTSLLTIFLSIFFLILFTTTMGYLVYVRAKVLRSTKEKLHAQNEQLENMSKQLSHYLSPQIYDAIFLQNKEVKIESNRKRLTIFFSDIAGFTDLTDRIESEVLTQMINNYLNLMSNIAIEHGGTIDKYIGDAIMIFFGDPESRGVKQDAISCIKMAIEMQARLKELYQEWDEQGIPETLKIRIGINTGFCTVGNFGSEYRLEYTIIGGQVNLASRLQTYAKPGEVLISEDTFTLIKNFFDCEKGEIVHLKGIGHAIQTYKVIGEKSS